MGLDALCAVLGGCFRDARAGEGSARYGIDEGIEEEERHRGQQQREGQPVANNEAREGDTVEIMETRPLSKEKRWRIVQVLQKVK